MATGKTKGKTPSILSALGKMQALLQGQLDAYTQTGTLLRREEAKMSETEKEQLRQLGY